jgi:hypothetical protein
VECAHHPARFIIFAELALLSLLIILIITILPIVGTCDVAQTFSDTNHYLVTHFFGSLVVDHAISAASVFFCSCVIAASSSSTRFLAPVVSFSTYSSIHFSFYSLLWKSVSHRVSAASIILDRTLRNIPRTRTLSTSKPQLPSFTF